LLHCLIAINHTAYQLNNLAIKQCNRPTSDTAIQYFVAYCTIEAAPVDTIMIC
jgi:hypothetical protein